MNRQCVHGQPARPAMGLRSRIAAAVLLATALAGAARADDINWRVDYNAARREASEKGLPLVLDFGTENCFWCRRLEETTFRESTVVALVNERFIPLKVDAGRNPYLTEALRVQSFPTLVFAAPDGKILGTFEGYLEGPRLVEMLQAAVAALASPEWMVRDVQAAASAAADSDFGRAVGLLKGVLKDGKATPAQTKARQLLAAIEQQAALRLARARQLEERSQFVDASESLGELIRLFPGTQAAADGSQAQAALNARPEARLQLRTKRARAILDQAQEEFRARQYLCCLDRCELLVSDFADLPEAAEATQILGEIKNNPQWMQQACEVLGDRLGFLHLALAEAWLKSGQPQQATLCLEHVVQVFPGTRQAEAARARLAQIQGQPGRQTEFKPPAAPAVTEVRKSAAEKPAP